MATWRVHIGLVVRACVLVLRSCDEEERFLVVRFLQALSQADNDYDPAEGRNISKLINLLNDHPNLRVLSAENVEMLKACVASLREQARAHCDLIAETLEAVLEVAARSSGLNGTS